jgi:predicted negative regulator of RcsB-dependent stress response
MSDLPENVKGAAGEQDFQLAEDDSMELLPQDTEEASEPGFEQRLDYARNLLQNSNLEGAFRVLQDLEVQYLAASSLFDLLGDVLIRKGNVEEGIHYKQLHQILSRTLQIARGAKRIEERVAEQKTSAYRATPTFEEFDPDLTYTPVTAAMAHELMRQGHFDKAAKILKVLVDQSPDDESLRKVRDRADKEVRENQVVRTLGGWLNNIKQIKASRSIVE